MGLIREPLDVDFTVDPRILTNEEKSMISKYIHDYKLDEAAKNNIVQKAEGKKFSRKGEPAGH